MSYYIPSWAYEKATPEMRERVQRAQSQGNLEIEWPDKKSSDLGLSSRDGPRPDSVSKAALSRRWWKMTNTLPKL
jgi:hypothetical protein